MIWIWVAQPFRHIAHSVNAKALEWVMALGAALVGYALAQPESTFSLSTSYLTIAAVVHAIGWTEEMMGFSIVGLAVIRFVILGINGLWKASPGPRGIISAAYALLWFLIWLGMYRSVGFVGTGTGLYFALMVGEIINMARCFYERSRFRHFVRSMPHAAGAGH